MEQSNGAVYEQLLAHQVREDIETADHALMRIGENPKRSRTSDQIAQAKVRAGT